MVRPIAIAALLIAGLLAGPVRAEPVRDWVVVYWMCYDNDLEPAGRPILDMLGEGVRDDRVAVAVFADFRGDGGMTRFVLTEQGEASSPLPGEGSAVPEQLGEALAWVAAELPARRYAVVFLNHGGRLGDSCHDGTPGEPGADWMWVPAMADVLEAWQAGLDGEVELLFLQQCGKGTLENQYELRRTAKVVMGSQTVVGAPNRYYARALEALSASPEADGEQLARWIVDFETADMFTTYTALRSEQLERLPERLDPLLRALIDSGVGQARSYGEVEDISFQQPPDEVFIDLEAALNAWHLAAEIQPSAVKGFATWLATELILHHRVSPRAGAGPRGWSGLTVMVAGPKSLARYAGYELYADTLLDEWLLRDHPAR